MRIKHKAIVAGVVAAAFAGPGAAAASADFVCPVLGANGNDNAQAGLAGADNGNPKLGTLSDGGWTIGGPNVSGGSVPDQATNTLPDGTSGSPSDPNVGFASPGDVGYTAIWNTD
jgi:hypothetical protein